jgi:2-polyprenyl-3-methyl-5-hydroxy-6-metoxy-1,4-benzoquinol methylase
MRDLAMRVNNRVQYFVHRVRCAFDSQFEKHEAELSYWRGRAAAEGTLRNEHYMPLYTDAFGLPTNFYSGKRVLDIGCGPRGSLEWCDMASERVGLDPLVPQYLKLGAIAHKMTYVAASSDRIPFPDAHFDVVTCLNALDHVDDLDSTIKEIKRVTRPGGRFLLSTEVNHPPTPTEPVSLSEDSLFLFLPEFEITANRLIGTPEDHDLHKAVLANHPTYVKGQPGILVASMMRNE